MLSVISLGTYYHKIFSLTIFLQSQDNICQYLILELD